MIAQLTVTPVEDVVYPFITPTAELGETSLCQHWVLLNAELETQNTKWELLAQYEAEGNEEFVA